jgi:hypothetical protein
MLGKRTSPPGPLSLEERGGLLGELGFFSEFEKVID